MLFRNISFSIFFKLTAMTISLLTIPLMLKTLGVANYGTWASLTSIIAWITLFDFGMGHALKNTVSKSIALNNIKLAQDEFFQVVKITLITSLLLLFIFFILINFINILKINMLTSITLFVPLILFFPLKIASFVLQGARKIALDAGLLFLHSLLFFTIISAFFIFKFKINLLIISISYLISYLFSMILLWIKAVKTLQLPIIHLPQVFTTKIVPGRINIGLRFFGLQLSSMVLYSMGTIIVYSYFGSEHAAQFDIINKIFIFGLSFFNVVIGAFWPEITIHLINKNITEIKKLYYKMLILSGIFSIGSITVAYLAPYIVQEWTNSQISIKSSQALFFALLISIQAFAYSGAVILNVYEKINIQLILSIVTALLMLPLSIFFIKYQFDIEAIPISSAILTFFVMIYVNAHAYVLLKEL